MIFSFLLSLLCFLAIGILSATRKQTNTEDYLLAGRAVNPWLTALSAVATNNSGFMFIGLIGATYRGGLSSMWIMIGWVCGEYCAWRWVFREFRERSQTAGTETVASFLATTFGSDETMEKNEHETSEDVTTARAPGDVDLAAGQSGGVPGRQRPVAVLAALVTLVFLGTYAAAQLTAGSKALHVLFHWDYLAGTLIGAGIVAAYCFAGGIRASIWTDAAQSFVMLLSMFLLLFVSLREMGGFGAFWERLAAIDPALIDWRPEDGKYGVGLFIVGWMFAGLGVLGQPHVMVRAMAIDRADHMATARRIYFVWYAGFSAAATLVGLCCRVLLPAATDFDEELALPLLSQQLLPEVLVGFILAGLFAATISTADSQILSCSAALTQDLFPRWGRSYAHTKFGTLLVTGMVVGIVIYASQNVFELVVLSWAALASSLGPLLAVRSLGVRVRTETGVAMIVAGLGTVLIWRYVLGLSDAVYDVLPGMTVGFAVFGIGRFAGRKETNLNEER